jgi:hypothetical protein
LNIKALGKNYYNEVTSSLWLSSGLLGDDLKGLFWGDIGGMKGGVVNCFLRVKYCSNDTSTASYFLPHTILYNIVFQ